MRVSGNSFFLLFRCLEVKNRENRKCERMGVLFIIYEFVSRLYQMIISAETEKYGIPS